MSIVADSGLVRTFRSLFATIAVTLLALSCASTVKAAEGSWSFSPASWDFGTLAPGTGPSPAKVFTLTNTGELELQAIFVSVSGNGGAGFSLAGNTCGKLAPGAKCEVSVTFDPSTPGPKDGQLQMASQGNLAPPVSAELSGTGAAPAISITPEMLKFDPLELGTGPSAPKTFTIRNDGQASLAISSILMLPIERSAALQFELAGGTCKAGVAVAPGASCTVDVTFSPTVPGAIATSLEIIDNAPGTPHYAYVQGFGLEFSSAHLVTDFVTRVPRAFIVHHPSRHTTSRHAVFRLRGSLTAAWLACKLDDRLWKTCGPTASYRRLRSGRHRFVVRAFPSGDGPWGPPTVFRWRIVSSRRAR